MCSRLPLGSISTRVTLLITLTGVILPFITVAWAQAIGGELIIRRDFPNTVLMAFNLASFLILAGIAFVVFRNLATKEPAAQRIRKSAVLVGTLALLAVSIHLHMSYWTSTSSTTPLIFLFYLPYTIAAMFIGCAVGWGVGEVNVRLAHLPPPALYALNFSLLTLFVFSNVYTSDFGRFNLPPPLGVSRGAGTLQKETFFQAPKGLGAITALTLKSCDADAEGKVTLTAWRGAAYVSGEGELKRIIRFEKVLGFRGFPVDVESDGFCEFVDNPGGWSPVGLLDREGQKLWAYGKPMSQKPDPKLIDAGAAPQDIIAFDATGDGYLNFLVPLLIVGRQETQVLRADGTPIRSLDVDLRGSRTADLDGDGQEELISLERSRDADRPSNYQLIIRDASLHVIKRLPLTPRRNARFRSPKLLNLAKWPDTHGTWHAFIHDEKRVRLFSLPAGQFIREFRIPVRYSDEIIPIRLTANHDPFLAVAHPYNRRPILSIYGLEQGLVYEETLRGGVELLALPSDTDGTETLLVSECGRDMCGKVWRYRLKAL